MVMKISKSDKISISKSLESIVNNMEKFIIWKDDRLYNKLVNRLRNSLINNYSKKRNEALTETLQYLNSFNPRTFTKNDVNKVLGIYEQKLGVEFPKTVKNDVIISTNATFKMGIKDVLKPIKFKLAFDVIDNEAIKILSKQNLFWIDNYFSDKLSSYFSETLEGYFNAGKTLEEVALEYQETLSTRKNNEIEYFDFIAEHQTNTIRELGKINAFEKAGIEYYEIKAIIDDRTSDICLALNGTIIPVSRAIAYRDNILSLSDPEDIKKASPWYKINDIIPNGSDLTQDELKGFKVEPESLPPGAEVPPFHGRCRTEIYAHFV